LNAELFKYDNSRFFGVGGDGARRIKETKIIKYIQLQTESINLVEFIT